MKKRNVWLAVFLTSLLLLGAAFGAIRPPQTADEVAVPDHTVPVITNVQISGNTVTMDVTGPFDDGSAIILVKAPSGPTYQYVSFTKAGDSLEGTITSLPSDASSWRIDTISLDMTSTPGVKILFYYEPDGTLESYYIRENPVYVKYNFDSEGRLTGYYTDDMYVSYDRDGSLGYYTVDTANGQQRYNGQHELEFEESTDPDTGTKTKLTYEDGVLIHRSVFYADDSVYHYDGRGTLRESHIPGDDGSKTLTTYDVNGKLHSSVLETAISYKVYDGAGNLVKVFRIDGTSYIYEEYENGRLVSKTVTAELPDGRIYDDIYENGVFTERIIYDEEIEYHYDALGNYTGKTVYDEELYRSYNADGDLTEYNAYSEQQGGVWLTYNHRNVLLSLEYYDPYYYAIYRYDAKKKVWYLNGLLYDGPVPVVLKDLKLAMEIVWYPNNTVCSFGPQFRDVDPDLTDLWYMFTPIDLSKDGTQTFELIGGNVYVLGQVAVTVSGDSVSVNYSTVKGKNGHIYIKSEYFNFFPDLKSVTTVVPEEIGEGFRFGETISIQNDLGGDTNVLLFVRNVATFRNFVDRDTLLRRYYKNYPSRVALRDTMLELID